MASQLSFANFEPSVPSLAPHTVEPTSIPRMGTREAAFPQPSETPDVGYSGAGTQADPVVLRDTDEDVLSSAPPLALNLELQHTMGRVETTESFPELLAQCLDAADTDRQRCQVLESVLAKSLDRQNELEMSRDQA
ncbi:MAG: hypothetical protein Q9207_006854 [Kuettlingeria erythrocarpa]